MTTGDSERVAAIRRGSRLLDSAVSIPGTRFSFGLDAVIGLVPGLGDAVGVIFSAAIVYQSYRLGASKRILTRMLYNVAVDGLLGAVPLLGDWHDLIWKANIKNADLLERQLEDPHSTARASGWFLAVIIAAIASLGMLSIMVAIWVIRAVFL